jgi:hypothetical protein
MSPLGTVFFRALQKTWRNAKPLMEVILPRDSTLADQQFRRRLSEIHRQGCA